MICKPCKEAPKSWEVSLIPYEALPEQILKHILARARKLHSKCEAPTTCACQHEVLRPGEGIIGGGTQAAAAR